MRLARLSRDDLRTAARAAWSAARRWPKTSLVVAAMLVYLFPVAQDLFYALPWTTRKEVGRVLFFALLGACFWRLWQVRPTDEMPGDDDRPVRGHAWIFALLSVALAVPMLRHPENLGNGDWDLFLSRYEGVRRTIVLFGEFPWWDPWTRGGFPLAANPECGVVGVATPLVLTFGTMIGMRLACLVYIFLAAEGTRRLARLWGIEPWSAVAAGFIFALNGGAVVSIVHCPFLLRCYGPLPWMLYHTFRLDRRPSDGFWLGFWLAFNVLDGIQYFSVYAVMIGAVVWLRVARVRSGEARRALLAHSVIALGTWLVLAGWRLATTGWVYYDFPRHTDPVADESLRNVLNHLLQRPWGGVFPGLIQKLAYGYYLDRTCYIGPVVFVLALASLFRGWRWWHTLAFACGWLAIGGVQWYQPSFWFKHWPLFSTMHSVTRWRFMAMLGVALAAASLLSRWRLSDRPGLRRLAAGLMLVIAADYLSLAYDVIPAAFFLTPADVVSPAPPVREIVQLYDTPEFPKVASGYGAIHGFEPLMGYTTVNFIEPTARLWRGHPRYVGEAWTDEGPVSPRSWSPNHIRFQVKPGQAVTINQNPGSWWLVNGRREFANLRCAEALREFTVRADGRGRLDLRIRPRGLELGVGSHLAGAILAIGGWIMARVLRHRNEVGGGPSARTLGGPSA